MPVKPTTRRTAARGATKPPTEPKAAGIKGKAMDSESAVMIHEGCSIQQLGDIFRHDSPKIKRLLGDLKPCGTRHTYPIYNLADAAARIVHPVSANNLDEFIAKMRTYGDLPSAVLKEFWAGLRARQIYEMAAGDLWPTDQVITHMSEMFKTISLTVRLTADTVQRETSLNNAQRQVITRHMDDLLANLAANIQELAEKNVIENLDKEIKRGREVPATTDDDSDL